MTPETVSAITNSVTALAACVGVYFGVMGINAWKKELAGKTKYELARRYLKSVYKVREAIGYVRGPFIPASEMYEALEKMGIEKEKFGDHLLGVSSTYQVRWEKVTGALSELDLELLEAEVLWGRGVVEAQSELRDCVRELNSKLYLHISSMKQPLSHDIKKAERIYEVIYNTGPDNAFSKEIELAVKKAEEYTRQYLS